MLGKTFRLKKRPLSKPSSFQPPSPSLRACPRSLSSLVHSPVTLNRGLTFSRGHPWLAVKRSGINVRVEERVERGGIG